MVPENKDDSTFVDTNKDDGSKGEDENKNDGTGGTPGDGSGEGEGAGEGTGEGTGEGDNGLPKWMAQAKGDNKTNESLKEFETINDLAEKYLEIKGKNAIPEKVEDYKFSDNEFLNEESLPKEMLSELKKNAFEKKVPKEAFNYAVSTYADIVKMQAERIKNKMLEGKKEANIKYEKEWGDNFTTNLSYLNKGIESFGGEELRTILNTSGLGNNPKIIDFLVEKGKSVTSKKALEGKQAEEKKNPGYITYESMKGM